MKVVLVNPPNNYHDTFELAPPLGLLTLAAAVRQDGVEVEILDLNLRATADHAFVRSRFYDRALALIDACAPDVVGITSMVVNSHVALELARRVKAADAGVHVVLGGTHFSSIAEEALVRYPWVDFVVKGEGELPFRALVRGLGSAIHSFAADAVPGVALRHRGDVIASHLRTRSEDMDEAPAPAYDLVNLDEYFLINPRRVLDYEPGRGCVYKCSFCYSPVHYGAGWQSKTIDRILGDMDRLRELGARHLFFVQDNFVNNARLAKEICAAVAGASLGLTWNCYTTLPQMSEEMMRSLGAAGCTNAFTGIDAVNEECQKEYLKRFFKGWEPLEQTLRWSMASGVRPTCAFLVENPSAGIDKVNRTLVTALFARCNGAGLRLNTLTLYNGTPSEETHRGDRLTYSELKPRLLLDTSELVQVNDYARDHPHLFPFHNTFLEPELWRRFAFGMHVAYTLLNSFPFTLYRWVTEDGGSLWGLVETLVDALPDLTGMEPYERRPRERQAFARWIERQPRMQRLTAETFELELAEWTVRRGAPERTKIHTPGNAKPREVVVPPSQVARLGYAPEDLHRFAVGSTPERGEPRLVAVKRNGRRLEYVDLPPYAVDALAALRRPAHGGAPSIAGEALDTLVCAGLLSEAVGAA